MMSKLEVEICFWKHGPSTTDDLTFPLVLCFLFPLVFHVSFRSLLVFHLIPEPLGKIRACTLRFYQDGDCQRSSEA
jgi:hypothetical protein